jgi:hypothetical protein
VAVAVLSWTAGARRHEASAYGINDPSSAALRVENRTSDFAIARVIIKDAEGLVTLQEEYGEITMGAEEVLEIEPGTILVSVYYVETAMAVMGRPSGSLEETVTVAPGKAAILVLQGGRSSPDGLVYVPPVLVEK